MSEAVVMRRELHSFIDELPDASLEAVRSLLSYLAKEPDGEPLVLETDLTDEERAIIAAGRKDFIERPEMFVALEDVE
jgi:hypothetical protein